MVSCGSLELYPASKEQDERRPLPVWFPKEASEKLLLPILQAKQFPDKSVGASSPGPVCLPMTYETHLIFQAFPGFVAGLPFPKEEQHLASCLHLSQFSRKGGCSRIATGV